MCLIVDANAVHLMFGNDKIGKIVLELISRGKTRVISGGLLKQELLRTRLGTVYRELLLSGAIKEFSEYECGEATKIYKANVAVTSDDWHVLALAHVSRVRILFSDDKALSADFKNKKVLPRPLGKVLKISVPKYNARRMLSQCKTCG